MGPEDLLAQAAWIHRLARALARDEAAADDLVQETYAAALAHPPQAGKPIRPWLAAILRNALRMRARTDARRGRREHDAAVETNAPSAEELLARAQLQHVLAKLVLELDEPYRRTVLLRYYEDLSSAEIARQLGIPEGTVRARLKHALDRLREQLDRETGSRKRWQVALAPFLRQRPAPLWQGALAVKATAKLGVAIAILLLALAGSWLWLRSARTRATTPATSSEMGTAARLGVGGGAPALGAQGELPAWFAQKGVPPRRVAGHVTFEARPVRGAQVRLVSLLTEAGAAAELLLETNAAGAFDFGVQPAASYTVTASAPNLTARTIDLDLQDPTTKPPPDQLELRLTGCRTRIYGTVKDAGGGPIAHARLRMLRGNWLDPRFKRLTGAVAETDTSGNYQMCAQVDIGLGAVEVVAAGYGSLIGRVLVVESTRRDFILTPEAVVVGKVIRADDGSPVPGALITLMPSLGGTMQGELRTANLHVISDSSGRFRFAGVGAGPHRLLAEADGLAMKRWEEVTVDAGQTSRQVLCRMFGATRISGIVVDHRGGRPVAGAALTIEPKAWWRSLTVLTQPDGSFVVESAPRGDVSVKVDGFDVISPTALALTQSEYAGLRVEVDGRSVVRGRVLRDGRGIPDADVWMNGPTTSRHTLSRVEGSYEIRGLPAGTYDSVAGSPSEEAFGEGQKVTVGRREVREGVDIQLDLAGKISGMVVDQNEKAVGGVFVRFALDEDQGIATTAPDGSFTATTLKGGGDYRVEVRPAVNSPIVLQPANGMAFPRVHVENGSSHVRGVRLAIKYERLRISGKVIDGDGKPQPDARVSATQANNGEPQFYLWQSLPNTVTDADGHFVIADLPAGTYALQGRNANGIEGVVRNVQAGRNDVSIVLQPTGVIEGTLIGFNEAPGVIAMPVMRWSGSTGSIIRGSVDGTRFRIEPVVVGTYQVSAATATDADAQTVEVTPGATVSISLRSHGTATVVGRVFEFKAGAPVAGLSCNAAISQGRTTMREDLAIDSVTDEDGRFRLEKVPAGPLAIPCWPQNALGSNYTSGIAWLNVGGGQTATIEMPVVKISEPRGTIGGLFESMVDLPRFATVDSGGPADRAGIRIGDVVTTVDGVSVDRLSAWGVLELIRGRPSGSRARLGLQRGGQAITIDVTVERN